MIIHEIIKNILQITKWFIDEQTKQNKNKRLKCFKLKIEENKLHF